MPAHQGDVQETCTYISYSLVFLSCSGGNIGGGGGVVYTLRKLSGFQWKHCGAKRNHRTKEILPCPQHLICDNVLRIFIPRCYHRSKEQQLRVAAMCTIKDK